MDEDNSCDCNASEYVSYVDSCVRLVRSLIEVFHSVFYVVLSERKNRNSFQNYKKIVRVVSNTKDNATLRHVFLSSLK